LLQAWELLRGRVPRSSVWALSLPIADGDADRARKILLAFSRALPVGAPGMQSDSERAVAGNAP